jgi:hypothetical protein
MKKLIFIFSISCLFVSGSCAKELSGTYICSPPGSIRILEFKSGNKVVQTMNISNYMELLETFDPVTYTIKGEYLRILGDLWDWKIKDNNTLVMANAQGLLAEQNGSVCKKK